MRTTNIRLKMIPTLNQAFVITTLVAGKPITFGIKYHKRTPGLQLELEQNCPYLKNNYYKSRMFRNLNNCMFCQTFLELSCEKTETKDYQYNFSGKNRYFEKDLIVFDKQKLDVNVGDPKRPPNNFLMIMGFKIQGYEDDLIYYYIQRKTYDHINKMNKLRTVSIQFSNESGYRALENYHEKAMNGFKKAEGMRFTTEALAE